MEELDSGARDQAIRDALDQESVPDDLLAALKDAAFVPGRVQGLHKPADLFDPRHTSLQKLLEDGQFPAAHIADRPKVGLGLDHQKK